MNSEGKFSAIQKMRAFDRTGILVAPFEYMLLGDLGAKIVKVESLEGDQTLRV